MRGRTIVIIGMLACAAAKSAGAQPIARADLTGMTGWFHANKSATDAYDDWYNRSFYGGVVAGWYWADHLRTEAEFGATSPGELFSIQPIDIEGQRTYLSSRRRFSTRRFTLGQQYQFFRNAWVHPHAAAGVDLTWETQQRRDDPVMLYDQATRTSRVVQAARTIGPSRDLQVRPFAELGTKLYVSRRAFFRTDLRLTLRSGIDEVVLRFGLGVDF